MRTISRIEAVIVRDATGAGTLISGPVSGEVLEIRVPNAGTAWTNGGTAGGTADLTITRLRDEGTICALSNLLPPVQIQPRTVVNDVTGGGSAILSQRGVPVDDHLKIVIAQGVASVSGTVFIHVLGKAV